MLVVTPNTCLDITTWLASLAPGSVARARRTVTSAGGKGVNVCRALRLLGHHPVLVGLASASDPQLTDLLLAEGCDFAPVRHDGPGRIAQVLLEDDGRVTVLNGPGPTIDADAWAGFLDVVHGKLGTPQPSASATEAGAVEIVACSGSLPPGAPLTAYADVVAVATEHEARTLVDAAPAVLAATLPAAPYLVTPNLAEAEAVLDGRVDELVDEDGVDMPGRAIRAADRLRARGPRYAVVTAGRFGAALAGADGAEWFDATPINAVNPIGSGDSFLGGVAHALDRGAPMRVAVTFGMTVAAAACETERAGIFEPGRLAELVAAGPPELAEVWEARS